MSNLATTTTAGTLVEAIGPRRPNRRSVIAAWRKPRRQQYRHVALYGDTAALLMALAAGHADAIIDLERVVPAAVAVPSWDIVSLCRIVLGTTTQT